MFKKLLWLILTLMVMIAVMLLMVVNEESILKNEQQVSAADVHNARQLVSRIVRQLNSKQEYSNHITLTEKDVSSLMALGSHLIPNTQVVANMTQFGVTVSSASKITYGGVSRYINLFCIIVPDGFELNYESCQLGQLPIPNFIAQKLVAAGLDLSLGEDMAKVVHESINTAIVKQGRITLLPSAQLDLKQGLNDSLTNLSSLNAMLSGTKQINSAALDEYLKVLNNQEIRNKKSLMHSLKAAFEFAAKRSVVSDPIVENQTAIWAIALTNGSRNLARLSALDIQVKPKAIYSTLHGRRDLSQHFVYSMLLEQLSDTTMALGIGQLKELMDSDGGTGYSFADMTANKAGMKLASFATKNKQSAIRAQELLAQLISESDFIPSIDNLEEGLSNKEFESKYGSLSSEQYQKVELLIEQRISELLLYQ